MNITLAELSKLTDCELIGDPMYTISEVADLESAGPEHASFFSNPNYTNANYVKILAQSKAGVIFVKTDCPIQNGQRYLLSENPSLAFQKTLEYFRPDNTNGFKGISHNAVIHNTAKIGDNVTVSHFAVIENNAYIGNNTHIGANVFIGANTHIGNNSYIHPNVTIREGIIIGNNVIIQPNAVIGSCGYGYYTDKMGRHTKLKQLGNVIINDDVEIGANTTIDRARFGSTIIGSGTKIDNLVQIAHGVKIGCNNLIVAQVGIAGSSITGRSVVIGGQAGVNGHLKISDFVQITARAVVTKNISKSGAYSGHPAIPLKEYQRQQINIKKIIKNKMNPQTL